MLRSVVTVILTLALASPLFAAAEEQKLPVAMVTDVAGLGDHGVNDAAWAGVKRASQEFSLPTSSIESRAKDDYEKNLFAAAEKGKVVVAAGADLVGAVQTVAAGRGATRFVLVGATIDGIPNVMSFDFRNEEAGFLAGVVAGLYTKTGVIAIVTGPDAQAAQAYAAGYLAGAKTADAATGKKAQVLVTPEASADDPAKGRRLIDDVAIVDDLITKKADVVFVTAANTRRALRAAQPHPGVKLILVDAGRDDAPRGDVLASVITRADNAVFEGIKAAVDNEWKSEHQVLGYREGGIGLSEMTESRKLFSTADLAMIERAKDLLGTAMITVPAKRADVTDWKVPSLKPLPAPSVESSSAAEAAK